MLAAAKVILTLVSTFCCLQQQEQTTRLSAPPLDDHEALGGATAASCEASDADQGKGKCRADQGKGKCRGQRNLRRRRNTCSHGQIAFRIEIGLQIYDSTHRDRHDTDLGHINASRTQGNIERVKAPPHLQGSRLRKRSRNTIDRDGAVQTEGVENAIRTVPGVRTCRAATGMSRNEGEGERSKRRGQRQVVGSGGNARWSAVYVSPVRLI